MIFDQKPIEDTRIEGHKLEWQNKIETHVANGQTNGQTNGCANGPAGRLHRDYFKSEANFLHWFNAAAQQLERDQRQLYTTEPSEQLLCTSLSDTGPVSETVIDLEEFLKVMAGHLAREQLEFHSETNHKKKQ